MSPFASLWDAAAARKGGDAALEALLPTPASREELLATPDSVWLSDMSRGVFQAGFNWKVVDRKWPAFEAAFDGFDPARWRMMSDDDLDRLLADKSLIRNGAKLLSVRDNAIFLWDLAQEHGSAARAFADWPRSDHVGLLETLKSRGSRLGGATGQYLLRRRGVDGFMTGGDALKALIREGVIDKAPTSKKAMAAVQAAFDRWSDESGRPFMQVSRVLAMTVPD